MVSLGIEKVVVTGTCSEFGIYGPVNPMIALIHVHHMVW